MIEDLVKNLKSANQELQMHCASAIFKVCRDDLKNTVRIGDSNASLLKLPDFPKTIAVAENIVHCKYNF